MGVSGASYMLMISTVSNRIFNMKRILSNCLRIVQSRNSLLLQCLGHLSLIHPFLRAFFFSLGSAITSYQNNCELSDGNDYLPMELQSKIFVSFLSLNALCHLIVSEAYNLMPHLCFCRVVRILNFFCITFQNKRCIIHNL